MQRGRWTLFPQPLLDLLAQHPSAVTGFLFPSAARQAVGDPELLSQRLDPSPTGGRRRVHPVRPAPHVRLAAAGRPASRSSRSPRGWAMACAPAGTRSPNHHPRLRARDRRNRAKPRSTNPQHCCMRGGGSAGHSLKSDAGADRALGGRLHLIRGGRVWPRRGDARIRGRSRSADLGRRRYRSGTRASVLADRQLAIAIRDLRKRGHRNAGRLLEDGRAGQGRARLHAPAVVRPEGGGHETPSK